MKDSFESKHHLFTNARRKVGSRILQNQKAFNGYSQTIDDIYDNLEDYNPSKNRQVLIVLNDIEYIVAM